MTATNAGGSGSATSTQTAAVAQSSQSTSMLLGDQSLANYADNNPAGTAQAFSYTPTASGTTTDIELYVNSGATATKLIVGLYSDASGTPGTLLTTGSLSAPQAGAWNDVAVGSATITQGTSYWIAVLGTGGVLNYLDTSSGTGASYVEAATGLTSLPSTYAPGAKYNVSPASAYVNGVPSGGGGGTTPPSNTALPTVSGTAQQGDTLTTSNGSWTGSPTSYAYQWQDCDSSGANCASISGATSSSYTLVSGDVGHTIRAVVTATNGGGSTAASSAQTAVVVAPPPAPPSNTGLPQISGTAAVGQTLTTSNGSWTNSPTSYQYAWQDCDSSGSNCTGISGANSSTYTVTTSDEGHTIQSVVTAGNAGGTSVSFSPVTATVPTPPPAAPSNSTAPAISGQAVQGQTLSTTNGSWTNSPTSYAYQWQDCDSSGANCASISGATSSSYTLVSGDVGHTSRAVVTATNAWRFDCGFLRSDGRRRGTAACAAVEYRASADQRHRGGRADAHHDQRVVDEQPHLVSIRLAGLR